MEDKITQHWTDAVIVTAFRKWNRHRSVTSQAVTEAMLKAARLKPGMRVLDLASGPGEPAIAFAEALGEEGLVIASDTSSGLLEIAKENAEQKDLKNIQFQIIDAHNLPFADRSFDLITCRFGVMFFEDCHRALLECHRVLKPAGRAMFAAWGPPEKQDHFLAVIKILGKYSAGLENEPGVTVPYRFAQAGELTFALQEAGFREIKEGCLKLMSRFPDSPEEYWGYFTETSFAFHPILERLTPDQMVQVKGDILAALKPKYDGENLNLAIEVVLATGLG